MLSDLPFLNTLLNRPQYVQPTIWLTHRAWASNQPGSSGVDCIFSARLNPIIHRCRIGKITQKSDA